MGFKLYTKGGTASPNGAYKNKGTYTLGIGLWIGMYM